MKRATKYSSCEWALLKRFSRPELKGQHRPRKYGDGDQRTRTFSNGGQRILFVPTFNVYKACFFVAFGSLPCTINVIHSVHTHTLSYRWPILLLQSTADCSPRSFPLRSVREPFVTKSWVKIAPCLESKQNAICHQMPNFAHEIS